MPDIPSDLPDLAYPYALDALSEHDRDAVERMLAAADAPTADAFRATVRDVRETLAAMTVVDATPAPADLEAKLQRALDSRLGGGTGRRARVMRYTGRHAHGMRWLAAAAAAVIVIGAGAGIVIYRSQSHQSAITAQQVISHADTHEKTVPMVGGGTITVDASRQMGLAVVSFDTAPAPPANHTYQLWLISPAGQVHSAGVLHAVPTRNAPLLVRFADASQLAVSIEPAGGSAAPTTKPIAGVPLA